MDSPAEVVPIFTPLNILLLSAAAYLVYMRLQPAVLPSIPSPAPPAVFTTYTPRMLQKYNGTDDARILIAVKGTVFDMSSGRMFYGPGAPYNIFAGRDASRGLAKGLLQDDMLTSVDKPVDGLGDLTPEEQQTLAGWYEQFEGKYLIVGELKNE
ncbi:hypothetical protein DRE_00313 [Drechslerella stenobrocha 248]|uniref:Cytochrome b5 heme-binding domain-containing protein n=1 Tax=Drechslerella stenobrocha 248 TaxID=1043628 RepID=W7IE95_9PEZI|nr:hypothetical protein DRE_00313 [Drechslerella stenobrocha 248]